MSLAIGVIPRWGQEEQRHQSKCGSLQPPMRMTRQKLTEQTIATWQPRIQRNLSAEDAREIVDNISGFFTVLAAWSRQEGQDTSGPSNTRSDDS